MSHPPRSDLGTFAHGQFRVDYEDRPDPHVLREKRVERAREAIRAAGLDALLVWKDENVRYLTNLRAQLIAGKTTQLNGCLLTARGAARAARSGGEVQRARVVMPWLEEIHAVPIMEARGLVRGAVEKTIATAARAAAVDACSASTRAVLARSRRCGELARTWSSPTATRRCRRAPDQAAGGDRADRGGVRDRARRVLEMAVQAIRPGVRETDVVAAAMHELYRLGGELSHVTTPFVASGEHMAPPNRIPSDKIIRNGDVVFIDIGAMWSGYFGDIGRTVICGKPSRRQQEVYTAVYEGLAAATETMRAGRHERRRRTRPCARRRRAAGSATTSSASSSATASASAPTSRPTSARTCRAPRR